MWRRRVSRIDSHDATAFPGAARRTRLLRLVFAGAAVALLCAAVASARDLDTRERGLLPRGTTGVVALDLSLSITDEDYGAARLALSRLIADDARIGLVVFSDIAYELLPPGTPAAELQPLMRLLRYPEFGGPPVNPWTQTFRAGTRVSTALELARDMLERDEIANPSILLVSDLETAPEDVPIVARAVDEIQGSGIELEVAALNPSSDAMQVFGDVIRDSPFVLPEDTTDEPGSQREAAYGVPGSLLILGGLLFAALAAHERFGARLALPLAPRGRRTS
jgi:hypothetical protein